MSPRQTEGHPSDGIEWSDQEWVARMLDGDERAFARFYDLHAPGLYRRLTRMLGDPTLAEDCLQHVFSEALRTMSTFRGDGKLEAWLERITTHVAMDQFRRKYRRRSFMERWSWGASSQESEEGLPEQIFLHRELREVVWDILEKVEPRKRMAILLCDLEGKSIEAAAEEMGVAMGTAASRLRNGRVEFRKKAVAEFRRRGLSIEDWIHE